MASNNCNVWIIKCGEGRIEIDLVAEGVTRQTADDELRNYSKHDHQGGWVEIRDDIGDNDIVSAWGSASDIIHALTVRKDMNL